MRIPMSSPEITDADRAAVLEVLRGTSLSIGPRIEAFERACAERVGVRHAIGVSSGTSGLHLAVIAAGIGNGDLVVTSPFSFVASANCILYERGIPVFVDVDPVTGNLDPAAAEEAVRDLCRGGARARRWLPPALRDAAADLPRLKALLPVHAFGQPADMDPLLSVAREFGLPVIEDACEAIGATYKGRAVGALGDAAVFAFYPNKQMTTGEGGMIVTDRDDWDALFRSLRNQGRDVVDTWLAHARLGFNYRLDEMRAALGLSQISRLDDLLARRERVARWYESHLAGCEAVDVPVVAPTTTRMSWFVYVVRILPPASRDEVMRRLDARGIPARPYFGPIHLQPFYVARHGYRPGAFPVTERLGDLSLALPFSSVMTEEQVVEVCDALRAAIAG